MSYVTDRFSGMERMQPAQACCPRNTQPMQRCRPMPMPPQMSMPLAMAWFEDQVFSDMYAPENALTRGTLFPELDKPWLAGKGGM